MAVYELKAELNNQQLIVYTTINGVKNILLIQENITGQRPFIHPILLPGHTQVLTENAPKHHPWQHGLYFAFHGVNHSDFWLDSGKDVGHYGENQTKLIENNKHNIKWQVNCTGFHHSNEKLFIETTTWSCELINENIRLKVDYKLKAVTDITIESCKYGGMFLRMPWNQNIKVDLINSAGHIGANAEQKTAEWLNMCFTWPDDSQYGVLILQHTLPTKDFSPWRVDNQFGIGPSDVIRGPIQIKNNQSLDLSYSLVFHQHLLNECERKNLISFLKEATLCLNA